MELLLSFFLSSIFLSDDVLSTKKKNSSLVPFPDANKVRRVLQAIHFNLSHQLVKDTMVAMLLLLDLNVANDMKYKSYSTNLQFMCLFFFSIPAGGQN